MAGVKRFTDLEAWRLASGPALSGKLQQQAPRELAQPPKSMTHLGGTSMFLGKEVGWGHRESTADFAQVLSQYVDVIVCRANSHRQVEDLAAYSTCSVVNGLTDRAHPCQALADLFTIQEVHGKLAGLRVAFLGDANNVARSLAVACGKMGVEFASRDAVGGI